MNFILHPDRSPIGPSAGECFAPRLVAGFFFGKKTQRKPHAVVACRPMLMLDAEHQGSVPSPSQGSRTFCHVAKMGFATSLPQVEG
jgi:hypothetical protein